MDRDAFRDNEQVALPGVQMVRHPGVVLFDIYIRQLFDRLSHHWPPSRYVNSPATKSPGE